MKNEDQFKSNLVAVGEVFSKEVSPALAKIYWRSLSQFTDNQVQAAFDRAVTNLKFFPKPAELIELIEGTRTEQAHGAWGILLRELSDSANAQLDPISVKTVESMGGIRYLATRSMRDLEFKEKTFVTIYESLSERDEFLGIENESRNDDPE